MNEALIIKTYQEGISSVINLVKSINDELETVRYKLEILEVENQKLNGRITDLESQVKKNSSKPPSSDGLKKKPRNMHKRTGKPTGGQPGNEGRTREKGKTPDDVVEIKPKQCECGCYLSDVK